MAWATSCSDGKLDNWLIASICCCDAAAFDATVDLVSTVSRPVGDMVFGCGCCDSVLADVELDSVASSTALRFPNLSKAGSGI
eukprot:gene7567-biopygen6430